MNYRLEADALDAAILTCIRKWQHDGEGLDDEGFNLLALRLFAHQVRYNAPYGAYCAALGFDDHRLPQHWTQIPAVPAGAFKEAALATFPTSEAVLCFKTSGTTQGRAGLHYMENSALYDASLLAGFDRAIIAQGPVLRYLNLVPNPAEFPHSSLGYMMRTISLERGDGCTGWYLKGQVLEFSALVDDLRSAIAQKQLVCIAGTAFAFVHLLEECRAQGLQFALPSGSRIMETGGFKGRSRVLGRDSLYRELSKSLGIASADIVAEYGMTELTSQFYDNAKTRAFTQRVKKGPPWVRALVRQPDGTLCSPGTVGILTHIDLANRSSVLAVLTEDLGWQADDGFVLLGRDEIAQVRGCSLDAEDLQRA